MKTPKIIILTTMLFLVSMAISNIALSQERSEEPIETNPIPPGGREGFFKYMLENLKYPAEAKEAKVEGKVMVSFVVNSDGSIGSIQVKQGIGSGCDEEAVRIVENSGIWTPGKQRGIPVNTRLTLPINFKL